MAGVAQNPLDGANATIASHQVFESGFLLDQRKRRMPIYRTLRKIETPLVFSIPAFQAIIGCTTQLLDGPAVKLVDLVVEFDGAVPVFVRVA
jgi:hypothetical protein